MNLGKERQVRYFFFIKNLGGTVDILCSLGARHLVDHKFWTGFLLKLSCFYNITKLSKRDVLLKYFNILFCRVRHKLNVAKVIQSRSSKSKTLR